MTVSERVRSCRGPAWLAQRSSVKQAFEWTTKSLLWCPYWCIEWWRAHQSLQPSFTALLSQAIFILRRIRLSFIRKTHLELFVFYLSFEKTCVFFEPQFGWISLNISPPHSALETKILQAKCYIRPAKPFKFKVALYSFLAHEAWVRMARAREYLKEEKKHNKHGGETSIAFHLPLSFLSRTSVHQKRLVKKYTSFVFP